MLKLRRIELCGFKSFYDRAEIQMGDAGVTAVVGPNGCGKSNISDAVAWVLGEQKARSLRGDRMEDVIFSGTGKRSQLGMAEVTISLVDDAPPAANGGPPPGPVEVTVQRRLYRSGESQYLLNGRPCRLRDIQDVFLGTGLGPNSYAIIEQGRVGQILSARPTDRRSLIEEAAGITKFKARRKLTESRLQAAQANLARVNDILSEVDRQRGSLKRQAAKARRYREVRQRQREVLAAVFSTRAERLIEGQERVAAALAEMAAEGRGLEALILELDARVHQARRDVAGQEQRLGATRELEVATKLELEKSHQQIQRLEDRVRSLEDRGRELAGEQERVAADIAARRAGLEAAESRLSELNAGHHALGDELRAGQEALEGVTLRRRAEEAAIDQLRERRFDVIGREARIRNDLAGKEELAGRLERQSERTRSEEEEAGLAAEGCRAKLQSAGMEQQAKQSRTEAMVAQLRRLEAELEGLKARHAGAQDELAAARSREDGIRHRLETIRELSVERAYGTESVQQFFNHVRRESWTPRGILADFIEVEAGYEGAVEDLLHAELQYVVVEDRVQADRGLALVRATTRGRLDFLVVDAAGRAAAPAASIPDARPVRDLVRFDARLGAPPPLVQDAYIVETLDEAWRLAHAHPAKTFVARSGEVVRDRVISWGERSGSGPLSLKREMRDLDRRIEEARRDSAAAAERVDELQAARRGLEGGIDELRRRLQESERDAVGLEHVADRLASELDRAEQRRRVARAEIDRLGEERAELASALQSAREELDQIHAAMRALDEDLAARGRAHAELREESERQTGVVSELRAQMAVLEERRETLRRDRAGLEAQARELSVRQGWIEGQIRGAATQKAEAAAAIAADTEARRTLVDRAAAIETEIHAQLQGLEQRRAQLQAAEAEWDGTRGALHAWKDRHNQREIERTEIDSEIKHQASLCVSELGDSLESVCLDSFVTLSPEELAAHEQEHQELRQRLEALGSVNMMAVEEYEEAEQRFAFLSGQRQDLLDSIRDTAQAIQEIDAVCRQQFDAAFTTINARFSEAFVELFGGGHGELRLIEEAEASEAGIEIVAQPPGKKLQNVLLLSGGEKALTALSLVIALFRFKPSPFCVLDEVDAPLDDANVGRFANMIRTMSEETQFIVITHSKRTMETANQLYGVTMEEPGISKIVSVRLN